MGHQTAVTDSNATGRVRIKRAYEPAAADSYRVLVDRLSPRGVSKEKAQFDIWMKDIAPSTELRRWFGHDPARWDEFARRYRTELAEPERSHLVEALAKRATQGLVTLVYGARDTLHTEAVVLCALVSAAYAAYADAPAPHTVQ